MEIGRQLADITSQGQIHSVWSRQAERAERGTKINGRAKSQIRNNIE